MNNTQEKSANIIAEMRNLGKLDEKSVDKIPRALMGLGLRTYADRLEAAIKREKAAIEAEALAAGGIVEASRRETPGNAAAMREALEMFVDVYRTTSYTLCIENLRPAYQKAVAALAAPPRNCDVGTAQEQEEGCRATGEVFHTLTLRNALTWAQMPYTKGGAK